MPYISEKRTIFMKKQSRNFYNTFPLRFSGSIFPYLFDFLQRIRDHSIHFFYVLVHRELPCQDLNKLIP